MSKLKVNELDSKTGTTVTVTTGKTLDIPAGATVSVAGTANLTNSTLTLPATLPATAGTNITSIPGANITGTIPAAALGNVDLTGLQDDIALLGFKVAANGSLAKYNLVDQTVDAFEDATGVDAATSTNAKRDVAGKYYYGSLAGTGGTETTYSSGGTDYSVHTFTEDGIYTSATTLNTDYFMVAGGGSGGGQHGAGGGAGGYLTAAALSFPVGAYPVTVGTGGASVVGSGVHVPGIDGTNTTLSGPGGFTTLTALKGGGGPGVGPVSQPAAWYLGVGGDGTYGSGSGGTSAAGTGGVGTSGQGFAGGQGNGTSGASNVSGGGGGGGGAIGGDGSGSGVTGGNGGTGIQNLYQTGVNQYYAGGGGGRGSTTGGTGGSGVGGAGGSNVVPTGGATNTGSGGGGSTSNVASGAGADGIVIIRIDSSLVDNLPLTLQSNATTAETAPTKGDIVMTYTNGAGTATLNTDLTAEFSADNGSTWTSTTLVAQGSTGTHLIAAAHDVTLTSTSGTEMKYRIKTLNQSAAKSTRIQAVSLGWS